MDKRLLFALIVSISINYLVFVQKCRHKNLPSNLPPISHSNIEPSSPEQILELPEFVEVPKFRNSEIGSVYGDIISHSKRAPFVSSDRAESAHETAHSIHSYLRNSQKGKVNGFYCLEGRGVIIEEPRMLKDQVNIFVPENLRSYRFSLYLGGQEAWNDRPLYLVDEWVAYILSGKTNVDDVQSGRYDGGQIDGVSGCLEFSIYCTALCMAIKEHDPEYWNNNKQFRRFMMWCLRESQQTYLLGYQMEQFQWAKQDQLLKDLLTSEAAIPMRKFLEENLEGAWIGFQ